MASNEVRTRTRDVVLVDVVRHSPVDEQLRATRRRWLRRGAGSVALLLVGTVAWRFSVDRPVRYAHVADHFKYGSIGSEPGGSLASAAGGLLPPYEIFQVLPQVCSDKLPGGYASLGFVYEAGHDLPIGVSRRFRLGLEQVGLNCAVCHTGTVRDAPGSERRVVLGMPSHQLALQDFFRFVLDCVMDERFTPDNVLGHIQQAGEELGWFDRLIYRIAVIPRTREQTLRLQRRLAILMGDKVPEWGPGRVDTFNPYKGLQFNWPLDRLPANELIGASDFPSLWNQKPRQEKPMQLHWDGNNDSVDERNLSASLGAGVTPATIDYESVARVRNWIWELPPPPYPYAIDPAKVARGREVYSRYCVECHADDRFKEGLVEGSRVGTVEPIELVGTDRYRLDNYTETFAANQYTLYAATGHRFTHFRKTNGYANQPLDGIWARAPYLHNGSVPTLRDLLEPPRARPRRFYRGYDVFDRGKVGFVSSVAEEQGRSFFLFDTSEPGNGNFGHLYGTDLPASAKDAVVEYLKTF